MWAYFARPSVTIAAPRGGLVAYVVRPGARLKFLHCKRCGCVIAWEQRARAKNARMALNARLFDHAAIADVSIEVLDGDKSWKTLERYTKPGIFISPTTSAPTRSTRKR